MVWDPQNPEIGNVDPPVDPILDHFVGILGQFGVKKRVFLKNILAPNHFLSVPRWSGTLKNPKLALYTPNGPHFVPFCGQKGRFWGQNRVFLKDVFIEK